MAGKRARPWVRPLVLLAISLIAGWIVIGIVGAIDWAAVRSSFGRLQAWQLLPLFGLFLLRQGLNAVPLSRFVPGLSWRRSVQSDVSANLVGTVAPPPGDIVLRVSMFRTWGIAPVDGMAGVTLNMITFYGVRFAAPVLGLLLVAAQGADRGQWVIAGAGGLLAAAILVSLVLVMRSEALAATVGRSAARAVRTVRSSVDAQRWAEATVDFRGRASDALREGLPVALASMLAMVLTDGLLLLTALRFVGLPAEVSTVDVLAAFLFAYPLTILPLFGFGLMDASLVASWTEIGGAAVEPVAVAGLAIWRAFTLLGPLAMGAAAVAWWRRQARLDQTSPGAEPSSRQSH